MKNISIKKGTLFAFILLTFFLILGGVSAVDVNNDSDIENSNLIKDDYLSSSNVKLESYNEESISQTNGIDSHEDNLGNYSDGSVISTD